MKPHTLFAFVFILMTAGTSLLRADKNADFLCVGSDCFPRVVEVGGRSIPIRGAALLRYLAWRVYTAAYWSSAGSGDFDASQTAQLELRYHRAIDRKDIIASMIECMKKNPDNDMAVLQPGITQAEQLLSSVIAGDVYQVIAEPGKGTTLVLNGVEQGTIPGDAFAEAFLGIWLSEHALDSGLRDKLLGIK